MDFLSSRPLPSPHFPHHHPTPASVFVASTTCFSGLSAHGFLSLAWLSKELGIPSKARESSGTQRGGKWFPLVQTPFCGA